MTRKICKYENIKEGSGDVECLIDGRNNCIGPDICDCFIDQRDVEKSAQR